MTRRGTTAHCVRFGIRRGEGESEPTGGGHLRKHKREQHDRESGLTWATAHPARAERPAPGSLPFRASLPVSGNHEFLRCSSLSVGAPSWQPEASLGHAISLTVAIECPRFDPFEEWAMCASCVQCAERLADWIFGVACADLAAPAVHQRAATGGPARRVTTSRCAPLSPAIPSGRCSQLARRIPRRPRSGGSGASRRPARSAGRFLCLGPANRRARKKHIRGETRLGHTGVE